MPASSVSVLQFNAFKSKYSARPATSWPYSLDRMSWIISLKKNNSEEVQQWLEEHQPLPSSAAGSPFRLTLDLVHATVGTALLFRYFHSF